MFSTAPRTYWNVEKKDRTHSSRQTQGTLGRLLGTTSDSSRLTQRRNGGSDQPTTVVPHPSEKSGLGVFCLGFPYRTDTHKIPLTKFGFLRNVVCVDQGGRGSFSDVSRRIRDLSTPLFSRLLTRLLRRVEDREQPVSYGCPINDGGEARNSSRLRLRSQGLSGTDMYTHQRGIASRGVFLQESDTVLTVVGQERSTLLSY